MGETIIFILVFFSYCEQGEEPDMPGLPLFGLIESTVYGQNIKYTL
jgi:hypothetical protein